MAWFNLFSGPTAEKLEQRADALAADGMWGQARLEYEHARRKLEAASDRDQDSLKRIGKKITIVREALAREHRHNAAQLTDIGDFEEAIDLVDLALELTGDPTLQAALTRQKQAIESAMAENHLRVLPDAEYERYPEPAIVDAPTPDEQFYALCNTLPDAVRRAYMEYGADFKSGYIALNNGDFTTAARDLARALEAQDASDSYIPLELATAYLHTNRITEAQQLLETLLGHHPDTLPAYQILCEIYWEQGAFDQADTLLAEIPPELAASLAVFVLKGETLFQAGRFKAAKRFYRDFIATYGWNESIARALARTHEALNEMDHALVVYQEIMGHCSGCHSRIDPLVKEKAADISFASGIHDSATLELYLALAQELPHNAAAYYAKVSHIYRTMGNENESRRFSVLADQLAVDGPERS